MYVCTCSGEQPSPPPPPPPIFKKIFFIEFFSSFLRSADEICGCLTGAETILSKWGGDFILVQVTWARYGREMCHLPYLEAQKKCFAGAKKMHP